MVVYFLFFQISSGTWCRRSGIACLIPHALFHEQRPQCCRASQARNFARNEPKNRNLLHLNLHLRLLLCLQLHPKPTSFLVSPNNLQKRLDPNRHLQGTLQLPQARGNCPRTTAGPGPSPVLRLTCGFTVQQSQRHQDESSMIM